VSGPALPSADRGGSPDALGSGSAPRWLTGGGPLKTLAGLLSAFSLAACVSRRIEAPAVLPTQTEATLAELVERVNERQRLQTLTAAGDLQFETHEAAEVGVARRFSKADGRILLARPNRLRLQIQVPLLKTSLAEMASDGDLFQLLVYPAEHRAFIEGSSSRDYSGQARKLRQDPDLARVGALLNVRPQHLVDAFLLAPIALGDPETIAVVAEERRIETDTRPGARAAAQVVRTYQVLEVIERHPDRLRFKFWFDQTQPDLPLTRYHTYEAEGRLSAEIRFAQYHLEPGGGPALPTVIQLDRPKDAYTLTLNLRAETLEVNRPLPDRAFGLEIPAEWGDSVRKIHLDEKVGR
jgi:hypothetical protein